MKSTIEINATKGNFTITEKPDLSDPAKYILSRDKKGRIVLVEKSITE